MDNNKKLELTPAGFKFSWITSLHFFASPNTPLLGEPFQNDCTFTFVWCPMEDLFIVSWRKLSAPLQPASDIRWWMSSHACIKNSPRKLTWQWNITICNMKKVFRGSIFQCYASLTECAKQIRFAGFFSDCLLQTSLSFASSTCTRYFTASWQDIFDAMTGPTRKQHPAPAIYPSPGNPVAVIHIPLGEKKIIPTAIPPRVACLFFCVL